MARTARSTVILGAATALALATAGWLTVGAAAADDTPPPTDPATPTSAPTDDPAVPVEGSVDDSTPTPEPTGDPKPDGATYTIPPLPSQLASAGTQSGNSFSSPISLSGRFPFPTSLDNTAATMQSHEPHSLQGGWYVTRSQWLKWKAPASGVIYVQVYGGSAAEDVGVNVYTGSSITGLHKVGSNDENYIPTDGAATVSGTAPHSAALLSLKVSKDKTYRFQVGESWPFPTGSGPGYDDITFWIAGANYQVSNDNLSSAKELKAGTGGYVETVGTLGGSSMESWEPYDNDEDTSAVRTASIWYKFVAPANGSAEFSNCEFLDLGISIDVFGESGAEGDLSHRAFDYGGYGSCTFLAGGGTVNVGFNKGEHVYIQSATTLGSIPREVTTSIQATFTSPWIEKLNHTSGKIGRTITITGQALNSGGTPVVKFGSKTATIVGIPTATSIVVKAPTHSLGHVDVTVKSGVYTSNKKSFTYTLG